MCGVDPKRKPGDPLTLEEAALLKDVIVPALTELKAASEGWTPPEMPEFEGDPLDLTPEQEAEIYRQIRKNRGHHDD
jgi:hypothetical protein